MLTHISEWHFILVVRALLVSLSLLSTASHGQGEKNGAPLPAPSTTQTGINPPSVEQTLVPESVFAMQLAEALKLGPVSDAAKAEELLSGLGIEPKNGWIAEYPVTPEVLGDIETGIAMASDQGKITFTKDEALKLFGDVKARLGFDVKPGPNPPAGLIKKPDNTTVYMFTDNNGVTHFTDDQDSIPEESRKKTKTISQSTLNQLSGGIGGRTAKSPGPQYTAKPNPEVINQQYNEQGPPVVTYYAPPDPYSYLYSWVPYPFWSTGFYYPGYYVLNDFHRRVHVNRHPYYISHHHGSGSDFPRSPKPGAINRDRQRSLKPHGKDHSARFSSPKAQAGARAIVEHNPNRHGSANGSSDSRRDRSRKPYSSAGNSGNFGNTPVVPNGRIVIPNDMYRPIPYSGNRNSGTFGNTPVVPGGRIQMNNDLYRPGFQGGGSFEGDGNSRGHGGGGFAGGGSRGGGHR